MARPPKDRQYRHFSAGLALGLCEYRRYEFNQGKLEVEFALAKAIRNWDYNEHFPAVLDAAHWKPGLDLYLIMQKRDQDKRTPAVPFYWDKYSGIPQIYANAQSDFDSTNEEDLTFVAKMIEDDFYIPFGAWAELAGNFLQNLDVANADPEG